jgi:methionyl-tRNA formyltransferase
VKLYSELEHSVEPLECETDHNSARSGSQEGEINSPIAPPSVVIIGRDKMAHDCLKYAAQRAGTKVAALITQVTDDARSRRLLRLCERHRIEVINTVDPNSETALRRMHAVSPGAIFNINGFKILDKEIVSLPPLGVVNFHNGPLPRYAGLNIPTWVIWNGESEHGVTWHFVDEGIDTGDVIAQSTFPVDERETAISLTMKCILLGIRMFDQVLADVLSGQAPRRQQAGRRTYYRAADAPNSGFIDFRWPAARIDRLLRALDFHPFPNPVIDPRVRWGDSYISLRVAKVMVEPRDIPMAPPGTIMKIAAEGIAVAIEGGQLIAKSFVGGDGRTLNVTQAVKRYGLSPGLRLG